jgi:hypothetical protein
MFLFFLQRQELWVAVFVYIGVYIGVVENFEQSHNLKYEQLCHMNLVS